jgi:hypothetical protein
MEYYDGDSLAIEINLVSNGVYWITFFCVSSLLVCNHNFYAITVYMVLATIANQKLQAHTSLCCKPHSTF